MPQSKATSLHIFKPGTHTTMGGARLQFSESDLQATVGAYDPALHEAPLVVGHPTTDGPAYGWVQGLAFSAGGAADGLTATPHQVNPEFADMVNAGSFKNISAAFYAPDAPGNPVPGVYYLRHVGFLGAQPPAIKGLRTPSFADSQEGVVTFSEWDDVDNASLWRSLREWFIGKFGQEEADRVVPGYQVQGLERGAQDDLREALATSDSSSSGDFIPSSLGTTFSETPPQETTVTAQEKAALEATNARLASDLAAAQATIATAHAAAASARSTQRHDAHTAFCEALPADKLLPAWRQMAVATLDHLAAQEAPVEFGEGEARAPLLDKFKEFLGALPSQVTFGEVATSAAAGATTVNVKDPQALADAATAVQAAAERDGRPIAFASAVSQVVASQRK